MNQNKSITNGQHVLREDYFEKVYAGWIGKMIGVRHGGNIEQWTYDRIERTFGEITGYLHEFKNFAADDDTNGPILFVRALNDYTHTTDITSEQMGLTWLNYTPDGHGLFWWGGYGNSTEHTAYLNLKNGIMAPQSGSVMQNGAAVAEQIGGQIFIDCWGLIAPGQPQLAAQYAEKMAAVSHDGNGKYGGMFIAACIAQAFTTSDIHAVIESGLSVIPAESHYAQMARDIIEFHRKHPRQWRDCFQYVYEHYGYDRYEGSCHIIPNSAVIILSLLYGQGDFNDSINICNMCGWDTDCNVGNVGTIVGVMNGLGGIDMYWRKPINDFLCCSSVIGALNLLDAPWCAAYFTRLGYKISGAEIPEKWSDILAGTAAKYHFELPGSTHAFRTYAQAVSSTSFVENSSEFAFSGERSLKVVFDYCNGGFSYRTFVKTYYEPHDFNDNRYDPCFTPIVFPGQHLSASIYLPKEGVQEALARLYVKDRNANVLHFGKQIRLVAGEWCQLRFNIPHMSDVCIVEAGIEVVPVQEEARSHQLPPLIFYIDDFDFGGQPDYAIDFQAERIEHWTVLHKEVSQLTYLRGLWTLEHGELSGSYHPGEPAEAYTGHLDWRDYSFKAVVIPKCGTHHNLNFRVQGAIRSYAIGLAADNRLVLYKNENGYRELKSVVFPWELNKAYTIEVLAIKNRFEIYVDDRQLMEVVDQDQPYLSGQIGFSVFHGSHAHYRSFAVKGFE